MSEKREAERCVRCRENPSSELLGALPTCLRCADLLRLKAEDTHMCPVDQTEMRKDVLQNLVIDRCPSCGGIWLDHDELEVLLRLAAEKSGDPGFLGSMLLDLAW